MCWGKASRSGGARQSALALDERRDLGDAGAGANVGEYERSVAAHLAGVSVHDFEARADVRCEVDLVDHQQVAAGDAGAALAGDLVAGGDVDDVYGQVGQFWAECGGEVVAAG